jgi:tRNA threonylcarbamoyl adenosine modification protein YeaZ
VLLAIDTSAGTSVAVVDRDGGILAESGVADTMRHAEVIGRLISETLAAAGVTPSQLSGVVAGMGPGPFTGLRVGIAAARTFAFAIGRPVVPVASHDGVAWEHYRAGGAGPLLVVTDARRREVFWSAFSGADELGLPMRIDGPALAKPDDIPYAEYPRLDATVIPAGGLGMIAETAFAAGRPFMADEALYLRSPDVTMSAGPKRVTR